MSVLVKLAGVAKRDLAVRLSSLGFTKGKRDGVFIKRLDEDRLVYFIGRPFKREGRVFLDPLIALENERLRRLIGEDEPRQSEPRFAHIYLAQTVGRKTTLWEFGDEQGLKLALDDIENVLKVGGIPFADRWTPFRAAVTLLKNSLAGAEPPGVVSHPTRMTRSALNDLPSEDKSVH